MSGIYLLADALLSALAAKLERDVILAKVRELEAGGATLDEVTHALRKMRDEAIQKAQDEINRSI